MPDDDHLQPGDIYNPGTRSDVHRLRVEFPGQSLGFCYYWYLYHKSDYEKTRSELKELSTLYNETNTAAEDGAPDVNVAKDPKTVHLGVFPTEIWQVISLHLEFDSLANLRLANTALADIAAELLVPKVRFNISFESLERLRCIAEHPQLSKGVTHLHLEADLIAPFGCKHSYADYYKATPNAVEPPTRPGGKVTPQARRLYARNLAKYKKDLNANFANYRKLFEAQQRIILGPKKPLFKCIDNFHNLKQLTLSADQCQHVRSHRFIEQFNQGGAVCIRPDPSQSAWELQNILRPGLEQLSVWLMSADFFNGEDNRSRAWLQSIFCSIKKLSLRMPAVRESELVPESVDSILRQGNLSLAVSAAEGLENLGINFFAGDQVAKLTDMVPQDQAFLQLRCLDLDSFSASEDELFNVLKIQPALKYLELAHVMLSTGTWKALFKRMRHELSLSTFTTAGTLEDGLIALDPEFCDVGAWQDGERFLLKFAIDMYVTDSMLADGFDSEEVFEAFWNPINRLEIGEFAPAEDLIIDYGPVDCSDLSDYFDSDGNDYSDMESDDESMVTAEESNNGGQDCANEQKGDGTQSVLGTESSQPMDVD